MNEPTHWICGACGQKDSLRATAMTIGPSHMCQADEKEDE